MKSSSQNLTVKCPTCGHPVPWAAEHSYKPFCSERCQLIDLSEWAMEEKRIPGEPLSEDTDSDSDTYWQ
jgi:uncharacterized protein